MAEGTKRFLTIKFESRKRRRYRIPYSCTFSESGLWIEGGREGGIFVGKLATGTIFSPPWKFVKDELRSFDYSLSLCLSFSLFIHFLSFVGYIYMCTSFAS